MREAKYHKDFQHLNRANDLCLVACRMRVGAMADAGADAGAEEYVGEVKHFIFQTDDLDMRTHFFTCMEKLAVEEGFYYKRVGGCEIHSSLNRGEILEYMEDRGGAHLHDMLESYLVEIRDGVEVSMYIVTLKIEHEVKMTIEATGVADLREKILEKRRHVIETVSEEDVDMIEIEKVGGGYVPEDDDEEDV